MDSAEELNLKIEEMRTTLQQLIIDKNDLLDIEVINFSKELDKAINNYINLNKSILEDIEIIVSSYSTCRWYKSKYKVYKLNRQV